MMVKWIDRAQWALLVAAAFAGVSVLMALPEGARVPLHYDASMRPDRWGSPFFGLLSLPVVGTLVWALQRYLPATSPQGRQLAAGSVPLALLRLAVTLIFVALHWHTLHLVRLSMG